MKRSVWFIFLFPLFAFAQKEESMTVYFRFDSFELEQAYRNKIDSFLRDKSVQHIFIEGHCDSIGSIAYNDVLSSRRARAVKNYILPNKFADSLISVKALGKRFPLNGNRNAEERALNRRAQIIFVIDTPSTGQLHIPLADSKPVQSEGQDFSRENDSTIHGIQTASVGETINLENINFYGGMHTWLPKSEKTLRQLFFTMKENPTLEIEIQGHICCIASGDGPDFEDNGRNVLSVNRAKAVYNYLVQNGIDESRLSFAGFGADRKLVRIERTEEDRESNRRVEIKILKK